MSDTKVYQFGETGASSNLLASYLPLLQQRGIDPSVLCAMGNGNGFGNFGMNEIIALVVIAAIFGNGNGGGIFGGGNNNSTEREMLMSAIQRNGTDLSQLAQTLNCSVGQVHAAVDNVATQICNLSAQTGQSSLQIINSLQSGQAALASQIAECCCRTQTAIQESNYLTERGFCQTKQTLAKGFSDLGYAFANQTCDLTNTIKDSTAQILAGQAAIEKRELQREIATLQDEKQTYKLGNMMTQANAPLAAAINALQSDVDGIKCRLPKTEVIPATPDYVQVNRSINIPYGPYCGYGAFGAGYGLGCANGWNGGSLWG